jgi:hypothetical protein
MKKIKLTQGKYALVDKEDYDWLSQYNWHAEKGHKNVWYARRLKSVRMHRVILKAKPGEIVDHINMNGLDNRRKNLRIVSKSENNRNQSLRSDKKTSKYKGVSKVGNRYQARIKTNGKESYLGLYKTELGARRAYLKAFKEREG